MTRYIIALTELGLKNNNLISLLREHSSDIVDMFENRSQRVFEKHLDLMPFYDIFSDSSAVNLALSKADDILTRNKSPQKQLLVLEPEHPQEFHITL